MEMNDIVGYKTAERRSVRGRLSTRYLCGRCNTPLTRWKQTGSVPSGICVLGQRIGCGKCGGKCDIMAWFQLMTPHAVTYQAD